ncbi:hypothetical protein BT93_E0894 [Corymbia citriodora subsp. variegata]|nr:hypothetical protein BT93_E0894 [Corymbia citriodora subsp. variegata]
MPSSRPTTILGVPCRGHSPLLASLSSSRGVLDLILLAFTMRTLEPFFTNRRGSLNRSCSSPSIANQVSVRLGNTMYSLVTNGGHGPPNEPSQECSLAEGD